MAPGAFSIADLSDRLASLFEGEEASGFLPELDRLIGWSGASRAAVLDAVRERWAEAAGPVDPDAQVPADDAAANVAASQQPPRPAPTDADRLAEVYGPEVEPEPDPVGVLVLPDPEPEPEHVGAAEPPPPPPEPPDPEPPPGPVLVLPPDPPDPESAPEPRKRGRPPGPPKPGARPRKPPLPPLGDPQTWAVKPKAAPAPMLDALTVARGVVDALENGTLAPDRLVMAIRARCKRHGLKADDVHDQLEALLKGAAQ
jgi:hypothetical protein